RQHLEALPKARQSSAEEDKARARAAVEGGQQAIDRLADESPSLLREYFEDELLPAWADAYLVGRPDADLFRERARLVGDALLRTTTDAMPRDIARALAEPVGASSRDPLRSQAIGYQALREAKRLSDLLEPSCCRYRAALRDLEAGGTPYVAWARQQVVTTCLLSSGQTAAMTELVPLEALASTHGYIQLLGRVRWLQGLIHVYRGELTVSLDRYRSAYASFHTTRDAESEAWILGSLAENLHVLGETRSAWRYRQRGLALLIEVRNPRRRHGMFSEVVLACLD